MSEEILYSAFVSRQMTFDEPADVVVHIMESKVAGFEVDGKQMLRQANGTYIPNDGTWFADRRDAVAAAIVIMEGRMASFATKIEELKKEVAEDVTR